MENSISLLYPSYKLITMLQFYRIFMISSTPKRLQHTKKHL